MEIKQTMTAEKSYPINTNRAEFGKVVPLATPFVLYLEPTRACNLRCSFCANPNFAANKKIHLSSELYDKFIEGIKDFDENIKILSINGLGEPLCHPKLAEFVSKAKDSGRVDKVRIITNGTLLNSKLNRELITAGTDMLWISVEAMTAEGYKAIADYNIDFQKFVDNIADLYAIRGNCKIYVKIVNVGLKDETERELFYNTFGGICDNILVENISNIYDNVDSVGKDNPHLNRFEDAVVEYLDICDYMFKGVQLNADGSCSPCPVDWEGKVSIGDLKTQTLKEIWNGELLKELRLRVLRGEICQISPCKNCYLYLNAKSSIIDIKSMEEHRLQIIERLSGGESD